MDELVELMVEVMMMPDDSTFFEKGGFSDNGGGTFRCTVLSAVCGKRSM